MGSERSVRPSVAQLLQTFTQDIRFALRVSIANPAFTVLAVLTLAVGIAASSTVFSWIDSVLLRPYPGVTDTGGLALLQTASGADPLAASSYLDYRDYRDNLKLVSAVAVGRFTPVTVGGDGNAERGWAELVSANYFDVLRVKPLLGRAFLPEEGADTPGAFPVAVVSHRMWQTRFQGKRDVLGTVVRVNRHPLTIVGVAPPEFRGSTAGFVYDVWMPITMARDMGAGDHTLTYRGCRDLTSTLVRLAPGVTLDQARAEVRALAKKPAAAHPDTNRGVEATLAPVWAGRFGAPGILLKPLAILAGACTLLLVVVCANVANLLLARTVSRQRELAVRFAFGARRGRLLRQLLSETLVLAGGGAAVGLVLVAWTGQSLNLLLPPVDFPFDLASRLGGRTLGFTVLLVVLATVASGLAPALASLRGDLTRALNEGGRAGVGGRRSHRLQALLVGIEVAVATAAVVGAALFVRSFQNARRIEPGFETRNVAIAQFHLSNAGYGADEQRSFCRALRERMAAVAGVVGVSYSDFVPLTSPGSSPQDQLEVDGYVPAPTERMIVHRATVPPGYFEFMGIRLLEGREFTERDEAAAPLVTIVNETFTRRFFGGQSPIGRTVRLKGAGASAIVVGEVRDSKYDAPTEGAAPYFYLPFDQWFAPGLNVAFLVKTAGDPMLAIPELRRQALALNQDAVFQPVRLTDAIGYSLYARRLSASLLSGVAVLCLLLAAVGLYGVISSA
jgi:predicted permease